MSSNLVLKMAVRMAIIPEISKQNYDTLAKQFREVIANSFDAGAEITRITVRNVGYGDNTQVQLIFEDSGQGMNIEEFKQDYLGVGGSWKIDNEDTIGRIGIGSLAVAVLAEKVMVETRKIGSDEVIVAELWIGEAVERLSSKSEEVQNVEVGRIVNVRQATNEDPEHFTRLTLINVNRNTATILKDKNKFKKVLEELERILPLKYPDEHPLLKKLPADLQEVLLDTTRLHTVKVLVAAPCLGEGYRILERYAYGHPSREDESIAGYPYSISPIIVPHGVNSNLTIYGYFVDAGKQLPEERRGLVVRVKNMGVELNTYFELGDAAANLRTTGEIFIENLDERNAMTINRNELTKEHPDYQAIKELLQPYLHHFQREIRGRVDINSTIKKHVEKAKGVKKAFDKVAKALEDADAHFDEIFEESTVLRNAEDVDVMEEIRTIDNSILVYDLPTIQRTHDIRHNDDEVEVTINSDLLENTITIGMEEYTYYLKKGCPDDPPCEINAIDNEIYINAGHPILESRGDQIIRAVIALRFAYLQANGDANKLYELTLEILGRAFNK